MTPSDATLEKLMDSFQMAVSTYIEWPGIPDEAPTEGWEAVCNQLTAARTALREYLSERTLTREEALFLYGIPAHPGCSPDVEEKRDAIVERFLDVTPRRASMKEHPANARITREAEQLTPEEAELLLTASELSSRWALEYQQAAFDRGLEKLRRLSQQGDTENEAR